MFVLAAAPLKSGSNTAEILTASVAHGGKTYYFIAVGLTDSIARGKADHGKLLDSIAMGY